MAATGDPAGTRDLRLGEIPRDGGGFRRVSRFPAPLALARLRARLLQAGLGGAGLLGDGLAGFESWQFLTTLCESAWTAGIRRDSAAAARVLQRRLRMLGTRPASFAVAAAAPAGTAVHLRGVARPMPGRGAHPGSGIWTVMTEEVEGIRLLVEEGHDFFLTDQAAATGTAGATVAAAACVITTGGHLINAERLMDGDTVSVFGFVDRIAEPRAEIRSAHARGDLSFALRSGDSLPLLVRRARQPGAEG